MTQSNIIIMIVGISIASTFGVYVAIKKINQYTRTPLNTLTRERGDIELIDYIEPKHPGETYYPVDLTIPHYINNGEYYENGRIHQVFINSSLEKNVDFIWFIIIIIIMFMIFIYLSSILKDLPPPS